MVLPLLTSMRFVAALEANAHVIVPPNARKDSSRLQSRIKGSLSARYSDPAIKELKELLI
jgi:hypothetical protein